MRACYITFCLHSRDMAFCQIHHMNIVAHSRTIGGWIIAAEYRQLRQPARSHLADIGQKVVGNTVGLFADQAAFVRADRVEIAQQNHAPARIGFLDVG
ncbi:Uncharacterised protein [Neisseria meningitidis]|nr:Uncharacterised protein [Neisseria meningitidis]